MAFTWTIKAQTRRQEGRKWLARIIGPNKDCERKQSLEYEFLIPIETKWGKYGTREASFRVERAGFYKDSDGDFFEAHEENGELTHKEATHEEVMRRFRMLSLGEVEEA